MTDKITRADNLSLEEEQSLEDGFEEGNLPRESGASSSLLNSKIFRDAQEEYHKEKTSRELKQPPQEIEIIRSKNSSQEKVVFKSAYDFCNAYVPVAHVVEPVLQSSKLYTLTARTGSGKTALLITIALAVVTGRSDILRLEVEKGRVAYLAFENPDDFCARLNVSAHRFNINLFDYQNDFVILGYREKPEEIVREIRKLAENDPFTLIIIDTLAAIYDGNDLNNSVEAGNFMRRLRPLTQISGSPAVVVASHPVKNAEKSNLSPSGSGAILNEIDGNLTLWKSGSDGNKVTLCHDKIRSASFNPIQFCFENATAPRIIDKKGQEIIIPVIVPIVDPNTSDQTDANKQSDINILRALLEQPGISAGNIGLIIKRSPTATNTRLHILINLGLVKLISRKWVLTKKGLQHLETSDGSSSN